MAREKVSEILDDAQQALHDKLLLLVRQAWYRRYRDPKTFLHIYGQFIRCGFWKDHGFESPWEWGISRNYSGTIEEWQGWTGLARLTYSKYLAAAIKSGAAIPERLAPLWDSLDDRNWRSWATLSRFLTESDLAKAVRAWKKFSRTGYEGRVVFIPLWIPHDKYKEVFGDRHSISARPWDQISAYFERLAKGR